MVQKYKHHRQKSTDLRTSFTPFELKKERRKSIDLPSSPVRVNTNEDEDEEKKLELETVADVIEGKNTELEPLVDSKSKYQEKLQRKKRKLLLNFNLRKEKFDFEKPSADTSPRSNHGDDNQSSFHKLQALSPRSIMGHIGHKKRPSHGDKSIMIPSDNDEVVQNKYSKKIEKKQKGKTFDDAGIIGPPSKETAFNNYLTNFFKIHRQKAHKNNNFYQKKKDKKGYTSERETEIDDLLIEEELRLRPSSDHSIRTSLEREEGVHLDCDLLADPDSYFPQLFSPVPVEEPVFSSPILHIDKPKYQTAKYPNWMAEYSTYLMDRKLLTIAWPGTHDSGSYAIDSSSELSPDLPDLPKKLCATFPTVVTKLMRLKPVTSCWAVAQARTIYRQLEDGIRYLDLRVCIVEGEYYLCHGMLSVTVSQIFQEIRTFLDQYPQEIILLDFNHFFELDLDAHYTLLKMLKKIIGIDRFVFRNDISELTFKDVWQSTGRLIAFYDEKSLVDETDWLWYQSQISSPWPATTDFSYLKHYLTSAFVNGLPSDKIHVTQGVLTPTSLTVTYGMIPIPYLVPNSLYKFSKRVSAKLVKILDNNEIWRKNVNVMIIDHYHRTNYIEVILKINQERFNLTNDDLKNGLKDASKDDLENGSHKHFA